MSDLPKQASFSELPAEHSPDPWRNQHKGKLPMKTQANTMQKLPGWLGLLLLALCGLSVVPGAGEQHYPRPVADGPCCDSASIRAGLDHGWSERNDHSQF